ncbi:hypothetical protein CYMTET_20058 [Cymbomonas tetramitiformis]|uniref:HEAT repeat domain-containing protein n=1 Tax=Cymbomonas tetramitiformis TaxID=36881 RepID=A0AAE0L497_9CHLO|nr:hypothetical protein CYMTET_20058 [Cymbomonas tetramitiformis]
MWAAVEALWRFREHAAPHAGAIAARLEHANAGVRFAAMEAVGRLGEHAAPHVGAIAARLKDSDANVRRAAMNAVGRPVVGYDLHAPGPHARAARLEYANARARRIALLPHGVIAAQLEDADVDVSATCRAIAARLEDGNADMRWEAVEHWGGWEACNAACRGHRAPHAGAIAARLQCNADVI